MRFAVLGCGVIGAVHARTIKALAPRAELVVAVDAVEERARAIADEHGVDASTSLDEVLARDDVDAVTICTPSGMHSDAAVAVLDAGKHVIIEKPLDVDLDAARRVLDAERRSDRTAMVISQHRHDLASRVVHEALTAGSFGTVTSGMALMPWWRSQAYYDSGDWRGTVEMDGGGALMNQGIHTLDLLVWFLGEPVEVFAYTGLLAHERIAVEDTAVATVRFASGALGIVHGTTAAYPGLTTRVQVHGDRGSAVIDHNQLAYFHAAGDGDEIRAHGVAGGGNQAEERIAAAAPVDRTTSHSEQFEDFLDAVEHGRPPLVTVETAARTLAVIRAIYTSAEAGRPVTIKELSV
ncbi:Gfo/Idh/MocA family protein [Pseudonocardia sp. TRM90224]|uniref:Gfo/Idh/MocA family protein n=1 Tax=Pseudonocardia sp. TRM90224 TaxID=2812678 RepID=UPI001E62E025|nr:Gfo/Idh/MocA family oxidoreductase [Pseudonocardia sp. TRM90224]